MTDGYLAMEKKRPNVIINNLPKVFVATLCVAYLVFTLIAGSEYEALLRFILYTPYTLAAITIFLGDVVLCSRGDKDGKVSVWLVTRTYAQLGFSLMFLGILGLVIVVFIYPDLEGIWILRYTSTGLIGGGMSMEVLTAVIMVWGLRDRERLGRHINPSIWRRQRKP